MKTKWNARGYVYGNLWGGGEGSYPSRKLSNFSSKKELIQEAQKQLDDGSLDSGMGYESLTSAILEIEKVSTINQKGKIFTNAEYSMKIIGKPSKKEKDFLIECLAMEGMGY